MAWLYLLVAGLFEVFWAFMMKLSHGFTDIRYSILTIIGMMISFSFLALAMRQLPLGLAYPIWTGIGAVGAILVGWLLFHEAISPTTWFFIGLLIIGLVGIKVTSGH